MKLLGWMHRKFKQNSGDVCKDFPTGSTCNCLTGGPSLDDQHLRSPVLPARILGRPMKDRPQSVDETLLFEGLLSIGTLGSGPIQEEEEAEAELQDLAIVIEEIAEKEETEEATETDLMVVNTELEKVLTEAAEKEGDSRLSSARPSHVNGGSRVNEACPLQEYLFSSATEGAEKERREKRASLGELFMIKEGGGRGSGEGEESKIKNREEDNEVNVTMKKMLKKSGSRGNSKRVDAAAKDDTNKTAKFQKILQIFHRKIHPENDMPSKKPSKSSKCKSKSTTSCTGSNRLIDGGGDLLVTLSKRTCRNKENKCGLDQPSFSLDGSNSTSSREHWIKTDADYLVLEL